MAFDPDKYLAAKKQSSFDPDKYLASRKSQPIKAPADTESIKDRLLRYLDVGGRGLDYLGGNTRAGIATALDNTVGTDLMRPGEYEDALKFNEHAPSSAQMLERAGLEDGKIADIAPGIYGDTFKAIRNLTGWDPSARNAIGFGLDVLSDPLTYATLGTSAARPVANSSESLGKMAYKSGLKRIDQEAMKYGKEPVSDLLMNNNIAGSAMGIQKQMDSLADQLLAKQKSILAQADATGNKVSMTNAMKDTQELIGNIRASKDPALQATADKLENEVGQYLKLDPQVASTVVEQVPTGKFDYSNPYNPTEIIQKLEKQIGGQAGVIPSQASGFKTSIYKSLPKGSWLENMAIANGTNPKLLEGRKAMARGLKEGVEAVSNPELAQINDDLGRILTTKDKQLAEAFKEQNKNALTSVDAMIAGSDNPTMLLLKKAADVAKMTGPRTYTGRAMYNLGKGEVTAPLMDILARQGLINANNDDEDTPPIPMDNRK